MCACLNRARYDYACVLALVRGFVPQNQLITVSLHVDLLESINLGVEGDNITPSGDALRHSLDSQLPNKASDKINPDKSLHDSIPIHIQDKPVSFPR